jgi:hypothetical protein
MGKHEEQDDKKKYEGNGYRPGPLQPEKPGGKHEKPDKDDKDDKDPKK